MSFKLLAIHVLENCYYDIRKIIPEGGFYQFYSTYDFSFENSKTKHVVSISTTEKERNTFYDIKRIGKDDITVDISAIVGQNGSGKSSILEIFYGFCLCISKDQTEIQNELNN